MYISANIHRGKMMKILIGASGSGINDVEWGNEDLPKIRIGINTACLKIPECNFVAALDEDVIRMPMVRKRFLITTDHGLKVSNYTGPSFVVQYHQYSMLAAIQFAINNNVNKIYFAGVDFGKTRDKQLEKYYDRLPEFYVKQYSKIKWKMFELLGDIKYELI